jgi:hypothetical protein
VVEAEVVKKVVVEVEQVDLENLNLLQLHIQLVL